MTTEVFSYSRKQAIDDGFLVDVSKTARKANLRLPVAITSSAWFSVIAVPDELLGEQDESVRLWEVLTMFKLAALKSDGQWLRFQVPVEKQAGIAPELVTLKANCGPGDNMEPVITIMLSGED